MDEDNLLPLFLLPYGYKLEKQDQSFHMVTGLEDKDYKYLKNQKTKLWAS